jgi:hypothetical protein
MATTPETEPEAVHAFKNCLTLALSYCGLLLDELEPGAPMRVDITEIQKSVQTALDMLPEILEGYGKKPKT